MTQTPGDQCELCGCVWAQGSVQKLEGAEAWRGQLTSLLPMAVLEGLESKLLWEYSLIKEKL